VISFITALLVFAFVQFVLTLALRFLNLGPTIHAREHVLANYSNKMVYLLLIGYVLLTAYSVINGVVVAAWFYVFALLLVALTLSALVGKAPDFRILGIVFAVPIVAMLMGMLMNGSMPSGQDEGRFAGFAYNIIREGKWQPHVYLENNYYQLFHVVPFILATISSITGLDILSLVHPLTSLVVTLIVSLDIYLIIRNLKERRSAGLGLLGPILFLTTPPIMTSGFIPQILAVTFYLTALLILGKSASGMPYNAKLITLFLISVIGVVTHATYPILLLSTLIPMLIASNSRQQQMAEPRLLKSVIYLVTVFTLVYWTYTLILDQLVGTSSSWINGLISLLMGGTRPFEAGRQVWYSGAAPEVAYSWVLPIALAMAYAFAVLLSGLTGLGKIRKNFRNLRHDWLAVLAITGVTMLGAALVLRSSSGGWGVRYFYPFYILLIPASAIVIEKITEKRRIMNMAAVLIMIGLVSFYALQDPMRSIGEKDLFLVANRRTWVVAESLAQNVSLEVDYLLDPRVGIPFTALTFRSTPSLFYKDLKPSYNAMLVVLNLDNLGEQWVKGRIEEETLQRVANDSSVVYTDGLYSAFYVSLR